MPQHGEVEQVEDDVVEETDVEFEIGELEQEAVRTAKELLEESGGGEEDDDEWGDFVVAEDPLIALVNPDGDIEHIETGNFNERGQAIRVPVKILDPGNSDLGSAYLMDPNKGDALYVLVRRMCPDKWLHKMVPKRDRNGKFVKEKDHKIVKVPQFEMTRVAFKSHLRQVLLRKLGVNGRFLRELSNMLDEDTTTKKSSKQSRKNTESGHRAASEKEQPQKNDSEPTSTSEDETNKS